MSKRAKVAYVFVSCLGSVILLWGLLALFRLEPGAPPAHDKRSSLRIGRLRDREEIVADLKSKHLSLTLVDRDRDTPEERWASIRNTDIARRVRAALAKMVSFHLSNDIDRLLQGPDGERSGLFLSGEVGFRQRLIVDEFNRVVWESGDNFLALIDELRESNDTDVVRIAAVYAQPDAVDGFDPLSFHRNGVGDILVELAVRRMKYPINMLIGEALASMRFTLAQAPKSGTSPTDMPLSETSIAEMAKLLIDDRVPKLRTSYLQSITALMRIAPQFQDYLVLSALDPTRSNTDRQVAATALMNSGVDPRLSLETAIALLNDPSAEMRRSATGFFSWTLSKNDAVECEAKSAYFAALFEKFKNETGLDREFKGQLATRLIEVDDPEYLREALGVIRQYDALEAEANRGVLQKLQTTFAAAAFQHGESEAYPNGRQMLVDELKGICEDLSVEATVRQEAMLALASLAYYESKKGSLGRASTLNAWILKVSERQGLDIRGLIKLKLPEVVWP